MLRVHRGGNLFFRVGPFNLIFSNCLFANFEIDIPIAVLCMMVLSV